MERQRAMLCGYYGRGNAGDEALLASLLQMLPSQIAPIVLSGNPRQTSDRFGVESIPARSAFPLLRALELCDSFIWGGGSLMQDASSWRNPIFYGGLMALAQQRGLKTIAWAQGIGPLNLASSRWIARQVLAGCEAVSVRDRPSAEILARWQIPAVVAPDPVWALEGVSFPRLWELPAPRIALTLRAHRSLTRQRLQVLTAALRTLQQATRAFIVVVPFQPQQDEAIAREVAQQLPGTSRVLVAEDPRELMGLFRGVEMAIGMRLHSLIMAAAAECRCFALSYDPKIERLMAELSIPGWRLQELPQDPNTISKAWLEQYVNGEALTPTQIQSLSDRAGIHRDLLQRAMSKSLGGA